MAAPMYQQIADDLRRQIDSGELAPGQQLPTELELKDKYEASRNTVRDAIRRLAASGLVESRPGAGTFVTRKIDPFVTTLSQDPQTGYGGGEGATYLSEVSAVHRDPTYGPIRVELQPATPVIALRLRIPSGDQVVLRHQERFIDRNPYSLMTSYFPFEFATKAPRLIKAEDVPEGFVRYLEEVMGIKQTSYRDWITARAADDNEQRFFGIPHDSTVFEVFRSTFDQNGNAMRVTVTVFPADRNQFIYNVGDPPGPQYDGG
ncbi:MAG TPA: GntR family transcriptional regulator [Trebonia sp.]|jgi:GntR family transcriptional regulator|nr:GntR family transcriptional regulator [Trebonia sp.]